MGLFDNWPYSDVHQLNLDWILKTVKEVKGKTDEIDQAVSDAQGYAENAESSANNAEEAANSIKDVIITPEMFGAVGDGNTDDTAAFKAAIAEAVNKNAPLIAIREYRISDTLNVDEFYSIFAVLGKIRTSFTDRPLLVFKDCEGCEIFVDAVNDTAGSYYGGYAFNTGSIYRYGLLANVAIQLDSCERCRVKGQVRNFNVGLRLGGLSAGGTVYNNIEGFSAWDCAYGIELYGISGNSWANQNYINSSTVSVQSGAPDREKTVPIHIFSANNAYPNNCNVFEGDFMTANNTGVMICIENGNYNTFHVRNEGNHKVIIDKGMYNVVKSQHASVSIETELPSNIGLNAVNEVLEGYELICKNDYEDLNIAYCKEGGSYYNLNCDKMDFGTVVSNVMYFDYALFTSAQITANQGFIPAQLGNLIELRDSHDLMLKLYHKTSSTDIRTCMYLLDSNKQIITNPLDYVTGSYNVTLAAGSNNRINAGANSNNVLIGVSLHEDVKYVFVFSSANYSGNEIYVRRPYVNDPTAKIGMLIRTHDYCYPYCPIYNSSIVTNKQHVGKRLLNMRNTDEWKCTAVDSDGNETWSNA